jgi:hypothetical protein
VKKDTRLAIRGESRNGKKDASLSANPAEILRTSFLMKIYIRPGISAAAALAGKAPHRLTGSTS